MNNTSIGLSKSTKLKLKRLKTIETETFESIILRFINISDYLKNKDKEYKKLGFGKYRDVTKMVKSNLCTKEIQRCDFLLNMVEYIESELSKR